MHTFRTAYQTIVVLLIGSIVAFGSAQAQDIEAEANVGAASAFIDQGEHISERPVMQGGGESHRGHLYGSGVCQRGPAD